MCADERGLKHLEITQKNIGIFFGVYNELGHGFLESVYEQAFSVLLAEHATEIEVGPLFNFGPKPQFRRFVFANERKQICVTPR
jgi:hypothetical protein